MNTTFCLFVKANFNLYNLLLFKSFKIYYNSMFLYIGKNISHSFLLFSSLLFSSLLFSSLLFFALLSVYTVQEKGLWKGIWIISLFLIVVYYAKSPSVLLYQCYSNNLCSCGSSSVILVLLTLQSCFPFPFVVLL